MLLVGSVILYREADVVSIGGKEETKGPSLSECLSGYVKYLLWHGWYVKYVQLCVCHMILEWWAICDT